MLDFKLSDEQQMLVGMTRSFVEKDMMPHEEILETKDFLPSDLAATLKKNLWSLVYMHVICLKK